MSTNPAPTLAPAVSPSGAGDTSFPVSFGQQRLWLLDRMLPSGGVYNTGQVVRLVGVLDVVALEGALRCLVQRHEALRTRFALVDGLPQQVVVAELAVKLVVEEVTGDTVAARAGQVLRCAQAEAQSGFDLERGPLWRVRLWRVEAEEHWLQVTLHHIVTDGWSMGVLVREMSVLYAALRSGATAVLPVLPVQYADYAVWQRQWLQGEVLARQVGYWREVLAQLPVLALPGDRRRPGVPSHRGGRVAVRLPVELTEGLKGLSRREGATLFMTLLAAFQVLLYRYSGQEDVAVGVPTAGRSRPEVEGLIGFFVNMLVMRGELSGAPSFGVYLSRVRERALEAYAHQEVPFEKLVEELAPKRDLARNPLFQVSMVLQNTPAAAWQLPGLRVERVEGVGSASAKFDLSLLLSESEGELAGSLEYASDLFDAATIERMAGHWRVLLEAIVATPEVSIAQLPLLTGAERAAVLAQGRGVVSGFPDRCVHELWAAQAARTPEAVAVVHGSRRLTYRELQAQASRLAQHLRGLGVGPDVLVGLCVPRSVDLVVGMLGILEAGGAYVPLDPGYPAARLGFMLADTRARVLVTRSELLGGLPGFDGQTVCMDRDAERIAAQPAKAPLNQATPAHLAYVIYTSGSTGRPKGVMVQHASVVGLAWKPDYVSISAHDVIGHASNVAFDAVTFEVWGALLNGARVAILDNDDILSASSMARAIDEQRITGMFLTTALFNELSSIDPHVFRGLRYLLFGGEAHDPVRVREVMLATPPRHLVHVYGPTETTTFATFHEVQREGIGATVPIGRPIGRAEILLLDARGALVPPGIVGEIHIGGSGVARGYLDRSDETARRFVAHPLQGDARVFRSGDLARWTSEGVLEYVGRNDAQVKIRGFRIEPAEVAAVIGEHPAVRACHVMPRKQPSGDWVLAAYFIPAAGTTRTTPLALQRHVASRLPSFMVPGSCIAMDAFPLTGNGKLDESAFPEPAGFTRSDAIEHAPPRDDTERALCRIWAEALGLAEVGIDDDFFALGGHSLLAARVFSRMDEQLGCSLPLGTLFQSPTIRDLAIRCRSTPSTQPFASLVAFARSGRDRARPPIFMVPGVYGNVVGFADLARALPEAHPFYGLQSIGLDGSEHPLISIEEIARRHLAEVRAIEPRGPYAFAGACFGATVAYEMARQAMEQGDEVAYLALLDPTPRGGKDADRAETPVPQSVKRAATLGRFAWDRLALYRDEMRKLSGADRLAFVAAKLRVIANRIRKPTGSDLRREMSQREVYRSNVAALDRYRRRPLSGRLRLLAIIESTRVQTDGARSLDDWTHSLRAEVVRHVVPGADSGDMLAGVNAQRVAAILAQHLQVAFARESRTAQPREELRAS